MAERLSDAWIAEYEAACRQGDECSRDSLRLLAEVLALRVERDALKAELELRVMEGDKGRFLLGPWLTETQALRERVRELPEAEALRSYICDIQTLASAWKATDPKGWTEWDEQVYQRGSNLLETLTALAHRAHTAAREACAHSWVDVSIKGGPREDFCPRCRQRRKLGGEKP